MAKASVWTYYHKANHSAFKICNQFIYILTRLNMTCGYCRGICQWGYLKFVSNPASESSKNRRYILLLWSLLLSSLLLLLQCVNVCPNIWPEINFGIWTIKNKTNPISFDINLQHYSRSQQQIFLFLSFPLSFSLPNKQE